MSAAKLLMRQVADGDKAAFETLAQRFANKMLAVAYRLFNGNQAMAEDAVQESLIKLWTKAPHYQPTGSVEGYICRIVQNTCYDVLRQQRIVVPFESKHEKPEKPSTTKNLEQVDQNNWLSDQLQTLPERQQTALLLVYFNGERYIDAAEQMGITLKALEGLVSRGLKALRDARTDPFIKTGGYLT